MGLINHFFGSFIMMLTDDSNTILDYMGYLVFILYTLSLIIGVILLAYNITYAIFKLDKDIYVTGHRWQHINILALYIVANILQYFTFISHILSHQAYFIDVWRDIMVTNSWVWALYLYTVFNVYVLIHLEQELKGKTFVKEVE